MTPRDRVVTFRPDSEILEAMEQLRDRDGIHFSEQVRRALRAFLEGKGVKVKSTPRRAVTRRKV